MAALGAMRGATRKRGKRLSGALLLAGLGFKIAMGVVWAQSSVPSLAEFQRKQDAGVAEAIRESQRRAQSGKLAMGRPIKGQLPVANRPPVIRLAAHPRQTGIDNRHRINVR